MRAPESLRPFLLLLSGLGLLGCVVISAPTMSVAVRTTPTVRVAAIQCPSGIGKLTQNRERITRLIVEAAKHGAKIIVLPECAIPGYMAPVENITWDKKPPGDGLSLAVGDVAESVPGKSTRYYGELAKRWSIFLTVPLIEAERGRYFNCVVLLGPDGQPVARHRKCNLWPPGDAGWASSGRGDAQLVATPYGTLGLMICYDVHVMPARLKNKADIVLYSVGWYGPNTEGWYKFTFPATYVRPNNFAVVAANWSAESPESEWSGAGYSSIVDRSGNVLNISHKTSGEEIIYADLPIQHASRTIVPAAKFLADVVDEE